MNNLSLPKPFKCQMSDKLFLPQQVKPEIVHMFNLKKNVFFVTVENEEYDLCVQASSDMWCNTKIGEFGEGLINNKEDPRKVERTGRLGEMAFSKVFNLPIDLNYINEGDQFDFILDLPEKSYTIDVKTAARNYNEGLIRALDDKGHYIELKCSHYVFGYIASEDRINRKAKVGLVGWESQENIIQRPLVNAKRGKHKNFSLPYIDLLPIEKYNDKWD